MQKAEPIFSKTFMRHIFHGTQGGGFHYEGAGMRAQFGASVIEETRGNISGKGIYTADVFIRGGRKKNTSSFFPQYWTRIQVLESVREAYATRRHLRDGFRWASGWSETYKLRVLMCLDGEGRVCTAYPLRGTPRSQSAIEGKRRRRARRTALRWWAFVLVMNWMKHHNLEAAFVQIEPLRKH
jgi:hypothetical protein